MDSCPFLSEALGVRQVRQMELLPKVLLHQYRDWAEKPYPLDGSKLLPRQTEHCSFRSKPEIAVAIAGGKAALPAVEPEFA